MLEALKYIQSNASIEHFLIPEYEQTGRLINHKIECLELIIRYVNL